MRTAVVMTGGGAGGLQQVAIPYAVALQAQGHDVTLVLSARSPLVEEARALGLSVELISWPRKPWPLRAFHVAHLRRILEAFHPNAVIGIAAKGYHEARLAAGPGVPVLSHCGDTRDKVVRKLLSADHLIVSSPEMARIAGHLGYADAKMSVVPNFLTGDVVAHDWARTGPVVIGAMGRFTARKGFDLLVDAARHLSGQGVDFRMVIAGAGAEERRLKAAARGLPISFPGWISNAEKSGFLRGLDVFVVPSRLEPFGNVYVDALQHGLPVVSTETTGARFIFAGGQGAIVVKPEDALALSGGIRALAGDAALRARLGAEGHSAFAARFSVSVAGPLLSQAVETCVKQFPSR
jgi:glycosyltransferase involved in cell wall biosynthesis